MTPVEFRIRFAAPIALTTDLPSHLEVAAVPKWRVLTVELQRAADDNYEMLVRLHPDDLKLETASADDLRAFHDTAMAMLAMTAVTPVIPLTKGTFTFPLGDNKFQQKSLGAMSMKGPPVPLQSALPLVIGFAATDAVQAAAYFLWQALNADLSLYRFMNLAVCAQIMANQDSTPQSVHPKCSNPACRFELEACPQCNREWLIPNSLRNRLSRTIADEALLSEFIALRNVVFHGSLATLRGNKLKRIETINKPLLILLRNIIGTNFGLHPVRSEDVPISGHDVDVTMSVFYTMPGNENRNS